MVSAHMMYIAGEWTDGESGVRMEATSPSTGEHIGTVPEGDREDVRRAITTAANDAWPGWAAQSAFERAGAMDRIANVIDKRREDLAQTLTLDQGKTATRRSLRRSGRTRRILSHGRRRHGAPRRRHAALRRRREASSALPRSAWGGRRYLPVELALHHAGRATRPGARHRQRRRLDARAEHLYLRHQTRRVHRRGGPAARRLQRDHRRRHHRRRRSRRQLRYPGGRLYRLG